MAAAMMIGLSTGFTPGSWRPDRPNGKETVPSGPPSPPDLPEPQSAEASGQRQREATAANQAALKAALAPRRWAPPPTDGNTDG